MPSGSVWHPSSSPDAFVIADLRLDVPDVVVTVLAVVVVVRMEDVLVDVVLVVDLDVFGPVVDSARLPSTQKPQFVSHVPRWSHVGQKSVSQKLGRSAQISMVSGFIRQRVVL